MQVQETCSYTSEAEKMSKNTPSLSLHQSVNNPLYDTLILKQETNEQIQLQQTKYKEKDFI